MREENEIGNKQMTQLIESSKIESKMLEEKLKAEIKGVKENNENLEKLNKETSIFVVKII